RPSRELPGGGPLDQVGTDPCQSFCPIGLDASPDDLVLEDHDDLDRPLAPVRDHVGLDLVSIVAARRLRRSPLPPSPCTLYLFRLFVHSRDLPPRRHPSAGQSVRSTTNAPRCMSQ